MATLRFTRSQSRQVDQLAIEKYGVSGLVLMENAGRGVVDTLERLGVEGPVLILCGKGNNAGDGFVIARHLEIRGHLCRVVLLCPPDEIKGDSRVNLEILSHCESPIEELAHLGNDTAALRSALDTLGGDADWMIDAMLGTGATGDPRPPFDDAIDWVNSRPAQKLAVDVPSGLDCDTGAPAQQTVRANHTCTFVASKRGFAERGATSYTGEIHVLNIGTPPCLLREVLGAESDSYGAVRDVAPVEGRQNPIAK